MTTPRWVVETDTVTEHRDRRGSLPRTICIRPGCSTMGAGACWHLSRWPSRDCPCRGQGVHSCRPHHSTALPRELAAVPPTSAASQTKLTQRGARELECVRLG